MAAGVTLQDGLNDQFKFTYSDSTGTHNVTLNLIPEDNGGTVNFGSAEDLLDRIRKRLLNDKNTDGSAINVEASLEDGYLVLKTKEAGNGTSISYSAVSTDPTADAIFGGLTRPTAAQTILNQPVKTNVNFSGKKTFNFTLDGSSPQSVEIAKWTTAEDLANKLNTAFTNKNIAVTASIVGGKLCLTKNDGGPGSIHIDYASGGSVITEGHMFGFQAKPGVTITTENNGKTLVIKGDPGTSIGVSSATSGGTMKKRTATAYIDPRQVSDNIGSGFHDANYSTVTSVKLDQNGIKLDRWNSDLQFTFTLGTGKAGVTTKPSKTVDIKLKGNPDANGVTSLADIKQELQTKIDKQLGAGAVEVLLDKDNRLIFKSMKPGAEFQFSGMKSAKNTEANPDINKVGGGFFHHVMCKYTTTEDKLPDPSDINGDQRAGDIFAQGRHDLTLDPAGLHPGISDTLELDLNYIADANHDGTLDAGEKANVKIITLTLHLDERTKPQSWIDTSSGEVVDIFRDKIKEAIKQAQTKNPDIVLHDNLIEVDIGRHDTGIAGNKDEVSLSFTITKDPDIATPTEGYFYIDGIRGNAAYETFYYTEGDLIPAYIEGTKDIRDGVVLGEHDNEIVLLVDDEIRKVDLSKLEKGKTISASEIINTITDQFKDQGLPLAVSLSRRGSLRISYTRMGLHRIEQVTGSAREELFFEEHAEKRPSREREIRISSFEGDRLSVYSPRFSTSMLGINSCCISTIKNAEKATNRLKEAIKKVADMRGTFGAIQNRFEHAVNNNLNKHENLQAAESRIRDADISTEMVEFSNLSIIQQAGQAVLAQANQSRNAMLTLLS